MYYTYILKSLSTEGAIYVGSTSNLKARFRQHNAGESVYTNKHKPWQVETYLAFRTKKEAEEFEHYLKSNSGKAFMLKRLVSQDFINRRSLYKNGRSKLL